MALTIATGFVVDDAIVVIENISRHLREGMPPLEAALRGAREIGFTVLSISVSLVAVFIPILLMGGIVGRLFREFAVTLSVAIAVSMVVSLTTTPMMCAHLLQAAKRTQPHGGLYRASERVFDWIIARTTLACRWVLRHQRLTLAIAAGDDRAQRFTCTSIVPKGSSRSRTPGRLMGAIQADQDTSFQAMRRSAGAISSDIVKADPAVEQRDRLHRRQRRQQPTPARMFVALKPLGERKLSADQVIARLRGKLARCPGATLFLQAVQDLRIGGRSSNAQYQFTLQSDRPAASSTSVGAARCCKRCASCRHWSTSTATSRTAACKRPWSIDRDTAVAPGHHAADDRRHAVRRLRPAAGLDDVHAAQPISRRDGGRAEFWQNPDALRHIYVRSTERRRKFRSAPSPTTSPTTAPLRSITRASSRQ